MDNIEFVGRRKIPDHLRKQPSEYPQLAFRLSREDKASFMRLATEVAKRLNKSAKDGEGHVTKGDVFVRALRIGFESLKK